MNCTKQVRILSWPEQEARETGCTGFRHGCQQGEPVSKMKTGGKPGKGLRLACTLFRKNLFSRINKEVDEEKKENVNDRNKVSLEELGEKG